ncbi:MAG: ATP-binding cassette domain-containing protein [Pirellulales bacterium]|nr:ATP-binding cassette domain-containing protein [Pirellulales bacterium]
MALIHLSDLSIGFRGPPLLDGVSCQIEARGRIGLLGRNGSGKTTLMRIISGEVEPDHGQCLVAPQTKVALLPQDVPDHLQGKTGDTVRQGLQIDLHDEAHTGEADQRVHSILSQMELDAESDVQSLSSGMKRRVLLAQTLVAQPDILLLDEPTNHLDITAIHWLEDFLLRWPATLLFVTHDRAFLRNLATRILEIDRGRLFDWSCDYDTFLARKEAALAAEEKQNALFDKKLAQEEIWIRQGIKARRTRNEGRVRALKKMREERSERRTAIGTSQLQIQEGGRSGRLVAEAKEITFSYEGCPIVQDFSTSIMRGDKIGIIGPNGAGKTTILKLLLGQIEPQTGSIRLGTNLEIAYFDQLRAQLDDEQTVQENISDGSDTISMGDKRKHIIGYLQDFLFTPERARTQVKFLSGGERNRLLLARLFAKPANVIVLDEPTNDLDTETLEMLEERLIEFEGTLLMVSHDRAFLNNVVTSTIAFEPTEVKEYIGGYDDWIRQRSDPTDQPNAKQKDKNTPTKPKQDKPSTSNKRKLSYKDKRELEMLPAKIEMLEAETSKLHQAMAVPEYYKRPPEQIATEQKRLKEIEQQLSDSYQRWEELEESAD